MSTPALQALIFAGMTGKPHSSRQRHPPRSQLVTQQKSRSIALKELPCP